MTLNYILQLIIHSDDRTTTEKSDHYIIKPNTEEDMRACVLDATTPALPAVGRALCSSMISHDTESRLHEGSAYDFQPAWYTERPVSKIAHYVASIRSVISGTVSSIVEFVSDGKISPPGYTLSTTERYI